MSYGPRFIPFSTCDAPDLLTIRKCFAKVNGRWLPREYAHVGNIVAVVATDQQGRFVFVERFRPAIGKSIMELPADACELAEDPAVGARRELAEETGCRAGNLRLLTSFYPSPGLADERMWIYLADAVTEREAHLDDEEELQVVRLSASECRAALAADRITDGKTIIGLLTYFGQLGRDG